MKRSSLIVFMLLGLVCSCSESTSTKPGPTPEGDVKTIVLVTIDTWRRDATGFLGEKDPSPTPFIDSLARRGVVATDAVTPVPYTAPAHWSMLTGRWPWADRVRVNGDLPTTIDADRTVAGVLRSQGWTTAAFVSCGVLGDQFGFAAGFEHYDDDFHAKGGIGLERMPERRGDQTVEKAHAWLHTTGPGDHVFIWVHLFDPHFPYDAPRERFDGDHGRYLAEVAFADAQVKRLADALDIAKRPLDESLWIVLSDHGEGLGEHGEPTHGLLLHGATTRIPLVVAGGPVEPRRYDGLVSTVDLYPTILGAAGVEGYESDGIDILTTSDPVDRAIPLETMYGASAFGVAPAYGLRHDRWLWEESPEDHLWNVVEDPDELSDVATGNDAVIESLRSAREDFGVVAYEPGETKDEETLKMLRSLGYVAGGAEAGEDSVREFVLEGWPRYEDMTRLMADQNYAEADRHVEAFLERYPRSPPVWMHGGFIALGLDDLEKAELRFRQVVLLEPRNIGGHINLGNVYLATEDVAKAELEFRAALRIDPEDLHSLFNLGAVLWQQGRRAAARPYWEAFVRLYPSHEQTPQIRSLLRR